VRKFIPQQPLSDGENPGIGDGTGTHDEDTMMDTPDIPEEGHAFTGREQEP
jgi:hypothetical protein